MKSTYGAMRVSGGGMIVMLCARVPTMGREETILGDQAPAARIT